MLFVGDVHSHFERLDDVILGESQPVVQVGDLGVGRGTEPDPILPPNFYFIRGNHDNPARSRAHSNYLGDYGYVEEWNLYYVSGAWSIDHAKRTPQVDWWPDEELDLAHLWNAVEQIEKIKPRILVTHEAPASVVEKLFGKESGTNTALALEDAFGLHQPEWWFFGHHHQFRNEVIGGTRFVCLPPLGTFEIDL
jgi:predicted phosphodiesterase